MREPTAVDRVLAYMRRQNVSLTDLLKIGGEDLNSHNSIQREKARRIEKTWALMAKTGLTWSDLARE